MKIWKLERNDTWGRKTEMIRHPHRPGFKNVTVFTTAWRVTSNYFIYGPWCYSRRAAIWQWVRAVFGATGFP